MLTDYIFTSESVSEGHPDKLADKISDTILDSFLEVDHKAKVACETFITDNLILIAGEFRTSPEDLFYKIQDEIPTLVREVLRETGYSGEFPGIDPETCKIQLQLNQQ